MMSELGLETGEFTQDVGELVEHVWREALGEIENILSISIKSIKAEQVMVSFVEFPFLLLFSNESTGCV